MREIRFRAWGRTWKDREKQMVIPGTREASDRTGLYHLDDFIDNDDFVLMQYTGLKDKNGKEIYEGDIVDSEIPNCRYQVFFASDKCGFFLRPILSPWNSRFMDQAKPLDVIGNIYENPELLGVEK